MTDICWSCAFPIKIAGNVELLSLNQEDTPNPNDALCFCNGEAGVHVSFWEPARTFESVRNPYCLSALGGMQLDIGFGSEMRGSTDPNNHSNAGFPGSEADKPRQANRHAHWYVTPLWVILGVVLDSNCLERESFDIAYLSEIDPTWHDPTLEGIFNPDAFLFGNFYAQAVCAADCVAASTPSSIGEYAGIPGYTPGFGFKDMFWCAGCNGNLYPLGGEIQTYEGGVQSSALMAQRTAARMHRMLTVWASHGSGGLCSTFPEVIMDKTKYKTTMYGQTRKIAGKCCQPFGRTTALWGAGREIPMKREDFPYLIFRKRNCCEGVFSFN